MTSSSCRSRPSFQTVTSLYESVVPPSEKCINYVKSVEVSRSKEKSLSPELGIVVNSIVEAENHLTLLEPEEGLAHQVDQHIPELSEAIVKDNRGREIPVEVELVELATSVKESLQFPEIEEILDSARTSEIGEVRLNSQLSFSEKLNSYYTVNHKIDTNTEFFNWDFIIQSEFISLLPSISFHSICDWSLNFLNNPALFLQIIILGIISHDQ